MFAEDWGERMSPENKERWVFHLFVSGGNPNIGPAVALLEKICKQHLEGGGDIEVINVNENPLAALNENILATPTLLKKLPLPERRLIGDITHEKNLLSALEIVLNE